jgi:hypothetical protein
VTDVNSNTEKGVENELKKLSDDFYKAGRQRLHTLILAIVSLTVSALSSSSPSRALNALTQFTSFVLLFYAFLHGLGADLNLISILHDAALLNLKRGVTVKALGSSNEQTSTLSRQPGSTLSNRLARLTRDPELILRLILASYIIEFIGLFNIVFSFITRVSGLSIQLQPLLSAFSMIVPISASMILGLSQWSVSTAVRGSLESSCTPVWLEMLKEVRVLLFVTFMSILFIYVYSIYLIPMSLTPSTRASYILMDSFYFGLGLGLLASLAFLLMLLTLFRDFIHLVCSREQTQENRG